MQQAVTKILAIITLTLVSVLGLSTSYAFAADPVDGAVAALSSSNVYVDNDATGMSADTVAYLQGFLRQDDHIVIVMLGQSSMTDQAAADRILASLPDKSVLGLSVNGHVIAQSNRPSVPSTAVNEALANAKAISMNQKETLGTFVRMVHKYQAAHPEPITQTQTQVPSAPQGVNVMPGVGLGVSVAVIIAAVGLYFKRRGSDPLPIKYAPPAVARELHEIKKFITKVHSSAMQDQLRLVVKHTEAFFRRSKDVPEQEVNGFASRLASAKDMLGYYIGIQDEPEYAAGDAQTLLREGREGIEGLVQSILAAIRDKSARSVLEFKMKTGNLQQAIDRDLR